MAGPGLLTVWGEGGGGVDQGVELVGVVVDLDGQGVHRLRVGQVAGQHPVGPSGPGRADRIQRAVAVWASSFIGKGSLVGGRSHGILSIVIHSQV
jgi:hypothetical protein